MLKKRREREERREREIRTVSENTLLDALNKCEKVNDVNGPIRLTSEEGVLVFFNFVISLCPSKAFISFEEAPHQPFVLKLQAVFEDGRPNLSEEERYYIANNWNSTKKFTRCRYNSSSSSSYHPGAFMLEYEILFPATMTHYFGVELFEKTLDMWHASAVACMLHILAYKRATLPFATHGSITQNTIEFQVSETESESHRNCSLRNQVCSICLENFRDQDWVRRLPCLHVFHSGRECNIDTHLVQDKQCPVCRTPIDAMEIDPHIPNKNDSPELARAVTNLQRRFNEFHNIVSNMRVMLQQLRQEWRRPQPAGGQSPPAIVSTSDTAADVDNNILEERLQRAARSVLERRRRERRERRSRGSNAHAQEQRDGEFAQDGVNANSSIDIPDTSVNIHTALPLSDVEPTPEVVDNSNEIPDDIAATMNELVEEADVIRLRLCRKTTTQREDRGAGEESETESAPVPIFSGACAPSPPHLPPRRDDIAVEEEGEKEEEIYSGDHGGDVHPYCSQLEELEPEADEDVHSVEEIAAVCGNSQSSME